jgi:hypothetical protein
MSKPRITGSVTADELAAEKARLLREDPEYRARVEAADAERREWRDALRRAERPVVEDLVGVGVDVSSVWDLVNSSKPYPLALPVLIEHLERGGYPDRAMESLGRALAVKPAVEFWARLKDRYLNARGAGEEDGAAVALAACAMAAQFDELIELLDVAERGESRIYFLRPIKNLGGAQGLAVLESLRKDAVFGKEARALLKGRAG